MDGLSVADNTTVVGGGPMSHIGDSMDYKNAYEPSPSSSKQTYVRATNVVSAPAANFTENANYLEKERPFFVTIGTDGLIAALQKLDRQLQNVSRWSLSMSLRG